jgi:hypothetical protein
LQETNLDVCEAKLVEEQARGLHPFDGQDLPAELEELHMRVIGAKDKRTAEAGKLSMLVMGISNALIDLGMLPILGISQLSKMAQEVLAVVGLILECLLEEHASDVGPWD